MAFTFCTSRLAELRAEERRRVVECSVLFIVFAYFIKIFGIKTCEVYAAMPATQFV